MTSTPIVLSEMKPKPRCDACNAMVGMPESTPPHEGLDLKGVRQETFIPKGTLSLYECRSCNFRLEKFAGDGLKNEWSFAD